MAFSYARLTEITTLPTSAGAVFTNPANQTTYIRLIVVHNANTSSEEVVLYNVPDDSGSVGTAGETNQFFKESLSAGETVMFEFAAPGLVLEDENDTIQGKADTANKVTIQIYGGKE